MKRHLILIAAIAALALPLSAAAQNFCIAADEWCQAGCEDLGPYVVDTFPSAESAIVFISNALTAIQRETVRTTLFPQPGRRAAVIYRLQAGQQRAVDPGSDTCPASRRPALREFNSIDTASVELHQLPLEVRATASIITVRGVPQVPASTAVLIYLEPYRVRDDQAAAGKR